MMTGRPPSQLKYLHRDWEEQAEKLCPQGYDVLRHNYLKEEPFSPARIVGAVRCR